MMLLSQVKANSVVQPKIDNQFLDFAKRQEVDDIVSGYGA